MHNFVISFAGSEGFANQEVREGWGRGRDGVGELEAARDSLRVQRLALRIRRDGKGGQGG